MAKKAPAKKTLVLIKKATPKTPANQIRMMKKKKSLLA